MIGGPSTRPALHTPLDFSSQKTRVCKPSFVARSSATLNYRRSVFGPKGESKNSTSAFSPRQSTSLPTPRGSYFGKTNACRMFISAEHDPPKSWEGCTAHRLSPEQEAEIVILCHEETIFKPFSPHSKPRQSGAYTWDCGPKSDSCREIRAFRSAASRSITWVPQVSLCRLSKEVAADLPIQEEQFAIHHNRGNATSPPGCASFRSARNCT